jgi:biopolymer transport protein ExbD
MATSSSWAREAAPMAEMNTTPLIDVMLVLLIMFIITVPSQSHQVEVALPRAAPLPPDWIQPLRNDLALSAGGDLSWNRHAITDAQLVGLLGAVAAAPKPPEVHFRPDASARFERVDEVLAIAARSGASTFGFVGNEQYRDSF